MNTDIGQLLHSVFQVNHLEETDVSHLEQLTERYPYFAPLQYLLDKKYRLCNTSAYDQQIKKTAIFFSNPHWLNDLIFSDEIGYSDKESAFESIEEKYEENNVMAFQGEKPKEADESFESQSQQIVTEGSEKPEFSPESTPGEDWIREPDADEIQTGLSGNNDGLNDLSTPESKDIPEENVMPAVPQMNIMSSDTEISTPESQSIDGDLELPSSETHFQPESENTEEITSKNAGESPLIPIEPYYTVDYFASQGIKLSSEEGKDKLSQKLRSFTEWLKTMKRIHPEKLDQEMDSRSSTVIQNIAEHSNEMDDVVTEAMAEVYARQGLRNKAAEVYQKLSLLNPNKRAYFAARISKLNEI